jgi:hypothetical protein
MRKSTIAVIAAGLLLVATGCGETTPELVDRTDSAAVEEAAEDAADAEGSDAEDESGDAAGPYRIGDTVAMGDLEHTVHGARWSTGDEWFGPDEDERWLVLDIEVTNNGGSSEVISSLIMWTLVDAENRTVDMTFTTDERGSLDGELGAGRSMRGEITYAVSDSGDSWELLFEPEVFGFGQAIYAIEADDVTEG